MIFTAQLTAFLLQFVLLDQSSLCLGESMDVYISQDTAGAQWMTHRVVLFVMCRYATPAADGTPFDQNSSAIHQVRSRSVD
jgi:hypothetical protein